MPALPPSRATRFARVIAVVVATAAPTVSQQFDELTGRGLPREFDRARVVVLRDVSGDGNVDLVVGEERLFPGAPLRLHLGGPDGVFSPAPAGAMPLRRCLPTAIVCADFDRDGDTDVFVASRDLVQNALFTNDGTGRFVDETTRRIPVSADDSRAAAAADVDGDGDVDLLVANVLGPDVLLLNDGAGRFQVRFPLPDLPSDDPTSMVFLDADADGDPDVVVGNARGQNRLWQNAGGGVFFDATATSLPADQDVTTALAAADVDGDGRMDLLVGNHATPDRVYRNDGGGRFSVRPTWMPASAGSTVGLAVFDADGDGDPDVYVARFGGKDLLLVNDGSGSHRAAASPWAAVTDHTVSVTVGDVDRDGDVDVVTGSGRSILSPGRKQLLLNDGSGSFASATHVAWPSASADSLAVTSGDLDGDGHVDVVVSAGSDVETWFGDGLGGLGRRSSVVTGVWPDIVQVLAVGDVDRDGDSDVLVGSASANVLLRNDGSGGLAVDSTALPRGGFHTRALLFADVDADGDLDVVEGNAGSSPWFAQPNRLLTNDGSGRFSDDTAARLPSRADFTFGAAAADVDRDGDVDLVFANWSVAVPTTPRQPNRLLLNDGSGRFTDAPPRVLPVDDDPTVSVAFGDVDGDGDPDLVTGNVRSQNRLYRNDGTGRFVEDPGALLGRRDSTIAIALADFDDDGDVDVLCGNEDTPNSILRNDGVAGFVDVGTPAFSGFPEATTDLTVVDVDHDGDADLIVANRSNQKDLILFGLTRQVDVPVPLRVGRGFTVDVYARPAAIGARAHLWVARRRVRPLSIPPFGRLLLDPNGLQTLGEVAVPVASGRGTFVLALPRIAALVGMELFFQSLVYSPSAPFDARLTNATRRVVGS